MTSGAAVGPCCGGQASDPPPRGLVVVSVVFLSIFFATFLILMSLAFCCCRRWRQRDAVSAYGVGGGGGPAGDSGDCAEPFPVEALPPAYAYVGSSDDGKHGGGGRECAVCLGAVRDGEMVRRLPACEHVYHGECIDGWLAAHRTCPLCRCELDPCKMEAGAPPAPAQEDDLVDQLLV
uniref:RING-type E3 ubiquitin transferase n=1 Tax=Leersia perrieri TaxID=77586 RepID=A0A0D9WQY5_9ORYZ